MADSKMSDKFSKIQLEDLHTNPLEDSYNSLFGTPRMVDMEMQPIDEAVLRDFGYDDALRKKLHRFRPYTQEQLEELAEDIRQNGLLNPPIVRKREGGEYEILAGHNRIHAARMAEMKVLSCIVKEVDDDTATIIMTTTNLNQREKLLPSEKGFAYKAQLEAMNRRGERTDLTYSQIANKLKKETSSEQLATQTGESKDKIFRYIRLTYLLQPWLDEVDSQKIGLMAANNLSFLSPATQKALFEMCRRDGIVLNLALSKELKEVFATQDATEEQLLGWVRRSSGKENKPKKESVQLSLSHKVYQKYFPDMEPQKAEKEIVKILKNHFEK